MIQQLRRELDQLTAALRKLRHQRGRADGYASLDADGRLPFSQLPTGTATHVLTANGVSVDPSYQPGGGGGGGGAPTFLGATVTLTGPADAGQVVLGGLSSLTAGKPVLVWQDASDAVELDALGMSGVVESATTIRIYWWSPRRIATGARSIRYLVGA